MYQNKPSVLACVTSQYDCDRIIEAAADFALQEDCELRVLSVLQPTTNYSLVCDQIEYLNSVAKASGADMTIMFRKDAAEATAEFVRENKVQRIVTGMHDGGSRSFLVRFNELAPLVSISMVDKDSMVYSMEISCHAK